MKTIHDVIKHFGSQAALAEAMGVERMSVTYWKTRGVPIRRAIQIDRMTDGLFPMQDLCPDEFGSDAAA